jgi:hypothetical protein
VDIVIHSAFVTVSFLGVVSEDLIPMPSRMTSQHVYEVRPRKDHRGIDLISGVLPYGRLWYGEFFSRSHDAVIRVYDAAGNVMETHEHAGDFKEW